jgi:hypothetical protein
VGKSADFRLDAIVTVRGHKWLNPLLVIAIENGVLGASNEQAIDFQGLFTAVRLSVE